MSRLPDGVLINYISPAGVTTDITGYVLFADAYFELQAAAVPGSFHLTVKDPDQVLSFTSGGRIELFLDTGKQFGGFVTVPTRDFFFPADRTDRPVKSRRWSLDGVDYNLLLDKRVLRNPADYTHSIPGLANTTDKVFIATFANYFDTDFSGGGVIDFATKVALVNDFGALTIVYGNQQGDTLRSVLDHLVVDTTRSDGKLACIYWMDAYARLNWTALQSEAAPWGFSDIPSAGFIGWREGSASEDGSSVINQDFIWGGSPLGSGGTVVLSEGHNDASIAAHGLWQLAETHFGEEGYGVVAGTQARANALISGDTSGTSPVTGAQGLVNPDLQYKLVWFAHDVPVSGGHRQHLVPGMLTPLKLWSFSEDGGVTPYSPVAGVDGLNVPLRQVRITFPTLPSNNPTADKLTYVRFEGTFGLLMSDPVWWWQYLRKMRAPLQPAPVITTSNSSSSYPYGSYFRDSPIESPDGSRVLFSIPPSYIPGSLEVAINGLPQSKGSSGSFVETDPVAGTFTFASAPVSTDVIVVACRTGA